MRAAWYEKQGTAWDVLTVGEMDQPQPLAGEVRIRVAASGVNRGDVKKRQNAFAVGMPYPRVVPHSDGTGIVDAVGKGEPQEWIGRRLSCYGAQSYRPFGTAAEYPGGSFGAGGPTARNRAGGAGRLSRYSRHDRSSGCSCGGSSRGAHPVGARRRGCGWSLRRSTRASSGSASHRPTCRSESDKQIVRRAGADKVLLI
jgi:NADPH:quinone reductase